MTRSLSRLNVRSAFSAPQSKPLKRTPRFSSRPAPKPLKRAPRLLFRPAPKPLKRTPRFSFRSAPKPFEWRRACFSAPLLNRLNGAALAFLLRSTTHFTRSLRMWRNWQTRKIQVLMVERSCRFKSCHPHQKTNKAVTFWSWLVFLQPIG